VESHRRNLTGVGFALPVPAGFAKAHTAKIIFDQRIPALGVREGSVLRFRFSPRDAKIWPYILESDFAPLNGQRGSFTALPPPSSRTAHPSTTHPQMWVDDPDPAAAEGVHPGAKSVNRWREDFLRDFAQRMNRRLAPLPMLK
jgi:hypothetical protein